MTATHGRAAGATVAVLGAGSWGTALSILLARNDYRVTLWGHDTAAAATLARDRENARYLPGIRFPDSLVTSADLASVACAHTRLLVAVPSHAFRATLTALAPSVQRGATLAWATKGIEPGGGKLLSDVAREELGERVAAGVVSGPTFAREVAQGLPTAFTVAALRVETAREIAGWFRGERVRVYTSDDMTGVQLGGAIKNVIAIATGISDGLGFGANARAALVTRGLAELMRLGARLGGHKETFMGLAGVGDLILTCTDNTSRNRRLGLALGRGETIERALTAIGQEVEGVATARELHGLAGRHAIEMPIAEQVYRVLHEGVSPAQAVEALLHRAPRAESDD